MAGAARGRVGRTAAWAVLLSLPLLASPGADAGPKGFVSSRDLSRVPGAFEPDARGGVEAVLRVRGDGSVVQAFRVWFQGLFDAEGATLWMALPGSTELEEVGEFATAENGSGRFEVKVDSNLSDNPELPLAVERVFELLRAPVEVRVPGADLDDEPVLRGRVAVFRYGSISGGGAGARGRRSRLRRPPEPLPVVDEEARGFLRVWRKRKADSFGDTAQGLSVFATGLVEDEFYEVWMEDPGGDLQEVGEILTTAEGQGYFSLDTRTGDTLPPEVDAEDVRDLYGRRVELRRFGFDDYSLAGLMPRVR